MKRAIKFVSFLFAILLCMSFVTMSAYAANVKQGSKGAEVRYVQYNLNMLGFSAGTVDGIAGTKTVSAIKDYQSSRGLTVDGIAGTKTQNALNGEIKSIQQLLKDKGFDPGTIDGVAGTNTINALKSFQAEVGLSATGICDAGTLAKLNETTPAPPASTLSIGAGNYDPGTLQQGQTYSISGTITSNYKITNVSVIVQMTNTTGSEISASAQPNATSYNINALDSMVKFGTLQGGKSYDLKVIATDASGTTKTLVEESFHVAAPVESTPESNPESEAESNPESGLAVCTHKFTSASGDTCTVCGYKYEAAMMPYPKTMEAVEDDIAVRNSPYAKSGKILRKLEKGECVEVTHFFKNSLGNTWFLTADGEYIYAENVQVHQPTYTLTYNANGGTGAPSAQSVQDVDLITLSYQTPSHTEYTFKGWALSKDAVSAQYRPGSKFIITGNVTLYAVWGEKYPSTGIITFSKQADGATKVSENFKVSEFACKDGSDEIPIDMELVGYLQKIRDHFGATVTINSGYRTPEHNEKIGGSTNSYHMYGRAADIVVKGHSPREVAQYAESIGIRGIELNERGNYVHIDTRDTKYWFVPVWSRNSEGNYFVSGYRAVSTFFD